MSRQTLTNARITDDDIAREIMESLAWDTRIHYPHIRVTVDGGLVFLSGVVERLVEKQAAEEDAARLAGVTQVMSNIVVRPDMPITDGEIAENIRRAFRRDVRIDEDEYEVWVENRVATIGGQVTSIIGKLDALDVAALTYGVAGLVDQIEVLPADPTSGHHLEALVSIALERTANLDERRIHAHIDDRTVTLTGDVDFLYQRREAERAVSDIPGVAQIRNEIGVEL